MTNFAQEFTAFVDSSRKFAEPALRLQSLSAKAYERMARQGYEAAGQYLSFGFDAVHGALNTTDVNALVQKHTDLAKSVFEFNSKTAQGLAQLGSEIQGELNQWFEQSAPDAVVRAVKAAKAA